MRCASVVELVGRKASLLAGWLTGIPRCASKPSRNSAWVPAWRADQLALCSGVAQRVNQTGRQSDRNWMGVGSRFEVRCDCPMPGTAFALPVLGHCLCALGWHTDGWKVAPTLRRAPEKLVGFEVARGEERAGGGAGSRRGPDPGARLGMSRGSTRTRR